MSLLTGSAMWRSLRSLWVFFWVYWFFWICFVCLDLLGLSGSATSVQAGVHVASLGLLCLHGSVARSFWVCYVHMGLLLDLFGSAMSTWVRN